MNSQFTIPRESIENYVKNNMDAVMNAMSIDYELESDTLETLSGDRTYMAYVVIQTELRVPLAQIEGIE